MKPARQKLVVPVLVALTAILHSSSAWADCGDYVHFLGKPSVPTLTEQVDPWFGHPFANHKTPFRRCHGAECGAHTPKSATAPIAPPSVQQNHDVLCNVIGDDPHILKQNLLSDAFFHLQSGSPIEIDRPPKLLSL